MEQPVIEVQEQPTSTINGNPPPRAASSVTSSATAVSPQACSTCGSAPAANGGTAAPPSWVYAIGNIEVRFPSMSIEKEFAQASGRDKTSGLTDRQSLHAVLSGLRIATWCANSVSSWPLRDWR